MTQSPVKKRAKLQNTTIKKRTVKINDNDQLLNSTQKRRRSEETKESLEIKLAGMKRKNFIIACEKVSQQSYFDYRKRFMLFSIPKCIKGTCEHRNPKKSTTAISNSVQDSFKIGIKNNSWYEAVDNFHMCLTHNPRNYLTGEVLKDIVEIMMNAHEDPYSEFTIYSILNKCKIILSLSFDIHPTCVCKGLKTSYKTFLTSPMDLKTESFSNRTEFSCNKGIVKYCLNRLENELLSEALDGPLINKAEFIPEDMKNSVQGLFWQKEKFEIFELLPRSERIERLMLVLDSVIHLLQSDLAIWQSRHSSNQGVHMMKANRPLIAAILWSDNVLYTGSFNTHCQQIVKIFVDFICLGYPSYHIKTISIWLNTIIQTFYMCESKSNSDYPNTGMYSMSFANGFYKIIQDFSTRNILKILKVIHPTYMRHLIGSFHIQTLLNTKESDMLKLLIEILKNSSWSKFLTTNKISNEIPPLKLPKSLKKLYSMDLSKLNFNTLNIKKEKYPKNVTDNTNEETTQKEFIQLLYVTFEAYLDSYSVQTVQNTIEQYNENLKLISNGEQPECNLNKECDNFYYVTEDFVRKYRSIYQLLKEFVMVFSKLKDEEKLHEEFLIFNNIIGL